MKGNLFSKSFTHRLYHGPTINNHVLDTLIDDLPNNDPMKNTIKSVYEKNGENG